MSDIKPPVRKEQQYPQRGDVWRWMVLDGNGNHICGDCTLDDADGIVAALNGEAAMRQLVRSFVKRFDIDDEQLRSEFEIDPITYHRLRPESSHE